MIKKNPSTFNATEQYNHDRKFGKESDDRQLRKKERPPGKETCTTQWKYLYIYDEPIQ